MKQTSDAFQCLADLQARVTKLNDMGGMIGLYDAAAVIEAIIDGFASQPRFEKCPDAQEVLDSLGSYCGILRDQIAAALPEMQPERPIDIDIRNEKILEHAIRRGASPSKIVSLVASLHAE